MLSMGRGPKLGVVGAGAVGTAVAYNAQIRGLAREIALFDINRSKVRAEVLDMAHGSQFTASRVIGGDDVEVLAGCDVVVVTAGAAQKPGETRLDLVNKNVAIMRSVLPQVIEQAPDAVIVLVTNPCDVLTAVAVEEFGVPSARLFSSGCVLDSSRLRWLVAEIARVSPTSVHAMVVGEHGDSEFPLWSSSRVGHTPLTEWTERGTRLFTPEILADMTQGVVRAAYTVIEGKGATNYAVGLAAGRIVQAVLRDEQTVLPVSRVLRAQELDPSLESLDGIALSLPTIVGAGGAERVVSPPMVEDERARLLRSGEALREVFETVRR
ncbi:L-lactate dehydrogenase [Mobilicoccus pelagius]|uniref:L-lactate dehydrogenase n=1 Tax=Mobilicoccus pelagius NBRC 104925 TaxID=1089455 RepID=H5UNR6_9MICO|nr:L-lactate dehydrogenase [Mobilicoccus pelagius NBRC 104925]